MNVKLRDQGANTFLKKKFGSFILAKALSKKVCKPVSKALYISDL